MNGDMVLVQSAEIDKIRASVSPYIQYARELVVSSPESYELGAQAVLKIKELKGDAHVKLNPIKVKTYGAYKEACGLYNSVIDPLDMAEKLIKTKCATYDDEQESERRRKEAILQAAALARQKKFDDDAKAKAKKETKKGNVEVAEAIMETIPQVPIPTVESKVPEVKGVSFRVVWHAEVVDERRIPRQYLIPDTQKLEGLARATKGSMSIPGVRFYSEKVMSAGPGRREI